ncbi:Rab-GTPase-TBC domain [Pseudocohnilembus persalinus]|uniref:Rab-GTPase-TBC domain n=1 Tax=Pseudocohnilembus persalinus TaxID=266149 RepID=A0A0V0QD21_PSEPJ|nr:Rab-GTPase-TBC domain [Pseudocohnilembus persalinus]|eukprot:KRX00008.1 Rab-GTPase-TBC domain [Pseudocohnilembus persalinus]
MEYENDFSDFILVYDKPQQQQILKKEDWDQIIMQNSLNGFRYKDIHYSLLKGIKYSTRKDIWLVLADVKSLKDEYQVNFKDLTKITSKDAGQIKKDVLRTYVEYKECNAEEFQKYLYQILNAYAILDPELGYAQGMNFIVAALLIHLDPNINSSVSEDTYIIEDKFIENSFWILIKKHELQKYINFVYLIANLQIQKGAYNEKKED